MLWQAGLLELRDTERRFLMLNVIAENANTFRCDGGYFCVQISNRSSWSLKRCKVQGRGGGGRRRVVCFYKRFFYSALCYLIDSLPLEKKKEKILKPV